MIRTEQGYAQIFKIYGKSETEVKEKLQDLLKCGGAVVIYTRRRGKDVHVLAETQAEDEESAKAALKPVAKEIKKALGDMYYSTKENETMEETVVRLLTKYGLTVTTAESCTGGMVAAKIINVPGASDVFDQGYITYSNKSKRKILDVSKATLKKYGAVSEQTAREMALGGVLAADADACVAVTGLAGPDGGTEEKPVGLVYVSCCMKDEVIVEECHFNCLFFRLFHDLLHRVPFDVESLSGIAYGLMDPVIDLAELLQILISEVQLPDGSAAGRHIVETVCMAQTARNALGGECKRQTCHADLLQITFHPCRE